MDPPSADDYVTVVKKFYGNSFIFQLCFAEEEDDALQTRADFDGEMLQDIMIDPAIESHVVRGLRTYCSLDERLILVSLLFNYEENQIQLACPLQTLCRDRKPES